MILNPYRFSASGHSVSSLFSITLNTGNGSSSHSAAGVDLTTGGLAWRKARSGTQAHALDFSPNGSSMSRFASDSTAAGAASPASFVSGGVNYSDATDNVNARTYVTWMWKKAAKVLDVVTYTGTGSAQTLSHTLGVVPAMILVKRLDTTGTCRVYHNTLGNNASLALSSTGIAGSGYWNTTSPTSSQFTVGTDPDVNANGGSYVAILFAHDAATDGVIQGFGYTGNGSASGPTVSLGWQPQFVLLKRASGSGAAWYVFDTARTPAFTGLDAQLTPNTTGTESALSAVLDLVSGGFQVVNSGSNYNASGSTYIGLAVRAP